MTAYVVRRGAQKKKGILEKRDAELLHQIQNHSSVEKLAKAAEKVRAAQNAVIKCLFHETEAVRPEDEERFAERWQHFERDRDYWENVSTAEIIELYQKRIESGNG